MKKNKKQNLKLNRRELLVGSASLGALASASNSVFAKEITSNNLPPNVPEWTGELGDGVDANPYGMPSEFEKNVVRRNVEWLTASNQSSVNFTQFKI